MRLAYVVFNDEVATFLNCDFTGVFEQGECLTCVAMLLSGQCSAEWNYFAFKYSLFEPYLRSIFKDFAQLVQTSIKLLELGDLEERLSAKEARLRV